LSDGRLPHNPAAHSLDRYGSGRPCNGCDKPILETQVERELDFDHGSRIVRFHLACETIWRGLVVRGTGKAADPSLCL
jgi:hypothetical protein